MGFDTIEINLVRVGNNEKSNILKSGTAAIYSLANISKDYEMFHFKCDFLEHVSGSTPFMYDIRNLKLTMNNQEK